MMTAERASLRDRIVPIQAAFGRSHPECCSQTVARALVALAEAAHAEGELGWSRVDDVITTITGDHGNAAAAVLSGLERAGMIRGRRGNPDQWPPPEDRFEVPADIVSIVVWGAP